MFHIREIKWRKLCRKLYNDYLYNFHVQFLHKDEWTGSTYRSHGERKAAYKILVTTPWEKRLYFKNLKSWWKGNIEMHLSDLLCVCVCVCVCVWCGRAECYEYRDEISGNIKADNLMPSWMATNCWMKILYRGRVWWGLALWEGRPVCVWASWKDHGHGMRLQNRVNTLNSKVTFFHELQCPKIFNDFSCCRI
jgi:hypothetical protein